MTTANDKLKFKTEEDRFKALEELPETPPTDQSQEEWEEQVAAEAEKIMKAEIDEAFVPESEPSQNADPKPDETPKPGETPKPPEVDPLADFKAAQERQFQQMREENARTLEEERKKHTEEINLIKENYRKLSSSQILQSNKSLETSSRSTSESDTNIYLEAMIIMKLFTKH